MSDIPAEPEWDDIVSLAEKGELDRSVLTRYVELDPSSPDPFSPWLRLANDIRTSSGTPVSSDEIVRVIQTNADRKTRDTALHRSESRARISKPRIRIAAEGDSWFNLPDFILFPRPYPQDIVDVLEKSFDVNRVSIWSDTLANMVGHLPKQYMQVLGGGNREHFLLSGGGNDIIGSINKYVSPRRPGDEEPDNAPDYILPSFTRRVDDLMDLFEEIVLDVSTIRGVKIITYVHGYANVIPKPGGKYVGSRLEDIGFDPATHPDFAARIVRELVNIFNVKLERFAGSRRNEVVYLDLRPHMTTASDWNWDEIHPSGSAAARLAQVFSQAIRSNTPQPGTT